MTLSSFLIQNLNQFLKYLTNKQRMTAVYKICSLKKKQKYIFDIIQMAWLGVLNIFPTNPKSGKHDL